jgi:arylsulfatase A-like enzyme
MKKLISPALALVYLLVLASSLLVAIQPEAAIFHPLSSIPRPMGILIIALLLFGVFRFVGYIFSVREYGRLRSRKGWVSTRESFLNHLKRTFLDIYTRSQSPWRSRLAEGVKLLWITAAAAYLLSLIEWIFHATKVSFMDSLNLGEKLAVLLLAGLFLAAVGMLINALLLLVELFLRPFRLAWLAACLNTLVPAALFTSLVVLWLDTFIYTIFRFGILTSDGLWRVVYGVLIILLFLELYRRLLKAQTITSTARPNRPGSKWLRFAVLGLLAVSCVLAAAQFSPKSEAAGLDESPSPAAQELPDIILIGSDGVSANNMSLYGYERETTPNIDAIADVSLVAENAFTNSSKTYGSIISLFTSKMPTRTQVMFPPDILHGVDSDQHLLTILKDMGYATAQIGVNEYVDANTWNIHNAFDWVNQRTVDGNALVKTFQHYGYELPAYFIYVTEGRLANRLLQALHIETVENPFSTVADAPQWRGDQRRMDDLLNLLDSTPGPLFIQVHLVETHGPFYHPILRSFSAGIEQDEKWMNDFYDDTILSYDAYMGELIEALKARGTFDQTMLIVYSDHAMGFQTAERIPLLFHFPAGQHAGRITTNVQNLDIAPTILDYLSVPIPAWMEGESILHFGNQVREPIFAVRMKVGQETDATEDGSSTVSISPILTENHQFSYLQIFYCQRVYQLDLIKGEWRLITVKKHTTPCDTDSLPTIAEIRQVAIDFLAEQGYDPSFVP